LAAVTGGELRIRDTVPGDLRMTRLVFDRLGCQMEFDGDDVVVPPAQRLRVRDDEGDAISKIEDGPWPAFPADLTSIALALATQSEGMVLVFEKMFENRLFFVDKLVYMGARILLCDPHRAVVSGPSRLHGERMESPDIRAVRPDEMRELRALSGSLHATFDRAGFGEVWTPALEYEEVLRRGEERAAAGFRLFDDRGHVLALRSDATIPIARLVANRYATEPGPLRLCYFAHAYRAVERGSGQAREFLQGGIELIGVGGAEGDAEVIALMVEALSEAGLRRHRIGLGDGMLYRTLLANAGVSAEDAQPLLESLWRRGLVGLE